LKAYYALFDSAKKVIPKATAKTTNPITKYNMVFIFKGCTTNLEQESELTKRFKTAFMNGNFDLTNKL
jgi:hypothetical protein